LRRFANPRGGGGGRVLGHSVGGRRDHRCHLGWPFVFQMRRRAAAILHTPDRPTADRWMAARSG
jgi:hypothetical protein